MAIEDNRKKALAAALGQIEKQFGKGSVMRLGDATAAIRHRSRSPPARWVSISRSASAACRAAAWSRSTVRKSSGKTTLALTVIAEAQTRRRHRRLRRCRARARSDVRREARRQRQGPAGLAAGHRRAGARDHRHAGALGRGRRRRHRLGRRAHAEGRDRGRDGRDAARPAGAPDVAGAAQAHRQHQALQHDRHLHQPDPHEDRRDVRQPGDDHRRQRAEVLRLACASTSAASARSRTATRWSATRPASRS